MARKRNTEPEILDDVEVLEQSGGGMGIDVGLIATTSFFLIAAIVMICLVLKNDYGAGPLA